jgi:hypothetical protein
MVRMAKAYCPKCRRILMQVLSSFECLSTWNKAEKYYAPGEDCKLVRRCPDCGTLTKEQEKKIERKAKKWWKRKANLATGSNSFQLT